MDILPHDIIKYILSYCGKAKQSYFLINKRWNKCSEQYFDTSLCEHSKNPLYKPIEWVCHYGRLESLRKLEQNEKNQPVNWELLTGLMLTNSTEHQVELMRYFTTKREREQLLEQAFRCEYKNEQVLAEIICSYKFKQRSLVKFIHCSIENRYCKLTIKLFLELKQLSVNDQKAIVKQLVEWNNHECLKLFFQQVDKVFGSTRSFYSYLFRLYLNLTKNFEYTDWLLDLFFSHKLINLNLDQNAFLEKCYRENRYLVVKRLLREKRIKPTRYDLYRAYHAKQEHIIKYLSKDPNVILDIFNRYSINAHILYSPLAAIGRINDLKPFESIVRLKYHPYLPIILPCLLNYYRTNNVLLRDDTILKLLGADYISNDKTICKILFRYPELNILNYLTPKSEYITDMIREHEHLHFGPLLSSVEDLDCYFNIIDYVIEMRCCQCFETAISFIPFEYLFNIKITTEIFTDPPDHIIKLICENERYLEHLITQPYFSEIIDNLIDDGYVYLANFFLPYLPQTVKEIKLSDRIYCYKGIYPLAPITESQFLFKTI